MQAWYIYFLQLTTDWTKEEKYGQLVMHCTALLVEFGHECPVMFDLAGFPGTLGQQVGCRAATRGKTAKTAVLGSIHIWRQIFG